MTNRWKSFFARIGDVIRTWEDALDYSPSEHAFARLHALENEVNRLKAELARQTPPRRSFFGES